MHPKVSVLMPVYNEESYLDVSIISVLMQKLKSFEFIIINDSSEDNSLEILESYADKDDRVKIIDNEQNLGVNRSLNKGLEYSKGDYIARQDADDISFPKRLSCQYTFLENNPDVFLCGGDSIKITEGGRKVGRKRKPKDFQEISRLLPKKNCFIHPTIMFRNDDSYSYRKKFKNTEDYDLYLRMLSDGHKLMNLDEVLIMQRLRKDSVTFSRPNEMTFYGEKAKLFYKQRIKNGEDKYEEFEPPDRHSFPKKNSRKNYLESVIENFYKSGKFNKARRYVRQYQREMGEWNLKVILYYLALYFPPIYKFYRKVIY